MNFKQILPYKLRRALTIGAIAGGTLTACEKNNEPPVIINPMRDVNVTFERITSPHEDYIIDVDLVRKYAKTSEIRHIYIVPVGNFAPCANSTISLIRRYLTDSIISIAPTKISGNSENGFNFLPKEKGNYKKETWPADSAWYVQHGWPIKQR